MKITLASNRHLSILVKLDTYAQQNPSRTDEIDVWLTNQAVYLLEVKSKIIGYGVVHRHFFGQQFIELVMIAKEHRGKGYGKKLITYFQQKIATEKLFTSTNQSNVLMQNLLIQLGFVESGYIENLDEGDAELIFCFIKNH
ncbi:GNAT family N-acetyltransferase [Proteus mirabilis]|uniref:GNAT family N-acetyltransferase n=2 Tax=Proteus mirabilis TaxID=584 RepID=UPI003314A176